MNGADGDRVATLQGFFSPISEQTGGNLVLVNPEDQVDAVVEALVGLHHP